MRNADGGGCRVVPSIDANAIYTGAIESLGFLDMPEDAWVCVCVCVCIYFILFHFLFEFGV